MDTEDFINIPSSNLPPGGVNDDACESVGDPIETDFLDMNPKVKDELVMEAAGTLSNSLNEDMEIEMTTGVEKDATNCMLAPPLNFELTGSVAVVETNKVISSEVHTENGSLTIKSESSLSTLDKVETLLSAREVDTGNQSLLVVCFLQLNLPALSGFKRPRITVDEQQPSVRVFYHSLTKDSKRKLEELLQQWSRWDAQSYPSSNDSNVVLESGEETFFPALCIGSNKPSAVSYWVDNQIKSSSSEEFIPVDGTSVPLYDRGFSLALTSADGSGILDGGGEKLDTSRCFNCGSYGHALRDCTKPRDHAAVNNARKEHKLRKNQTANSRNSSRYYEISQGGKYDGLTPGVLDAETRKIMGLGDLDPPPWLNRMREIGYPPGYLDQDEENQPSGITIFGDESHKPETEEGEIFDPNHINPSKKMSVKFPGINAPIPENADKWLWAVNSSNSNPSRDSSRDRSYRRYNHSSEDNINSSRVNHDYQERKRYRDRDFEDDGPPGCEPGSSPSLSYHFRSRYGDYDSSSHHTLHSPQSSPWSSSSFSRSLSERGRWSARERDGSSSQGQYGDLSRSYPR